MRHLTLLTLFVSLFSCEAPLSVELPVLDDNFIIFTLGGETQLLNGITQRAQSLYRPAAEGIDSKLELVAATPDDRVVIRIIATGVYNDVTKGRLSAAATRTVEARLDVASEEDMSGSIYCPHPNASTGTTYPILLTLKDWSEEGVVTGSFRSNPEFESLVDFVDGEFSLIVLNP